MFCVGVFGVLVNLGDYGVNLLDFQVNEVVHDSLSLLDVFPEQGEVEARLRGEGVFNVGVEIDCEQAAAIVGTEGNFAAGIR